VLVTDRLRSLRVGDRMIEQIGLPYHWGSNGLSTGDSSNDLVNLTLDPNVFIQDKGGTCDIQPGRRPQGRDLPPYVASYRERAGVAQEEPQSTTGSGNGSGSGSTGSGHGPTGSTNGSAGSIEKGDSP
jgi:formate dehydrogenase major subunit